MYDNIKVAVCCVGRLENRYAVEFVEHYKKLGFDNIFICDNNKYNEEHFEDVLQPYISSEFVYILDYRSKTKIQLKSYIDTYNLISCEYDWIFFCDFDEFLILEKDNNIKEYLARDCFNKYNQILINWKLYDDNNLIYDDGRTCLERFTNPLPINKLIDDSYFPENMHVKPIIRTKLRDFKMYTPHDGYCDDLITKTCLNNGVQENISPFCAKFNINYELAHIKHFITKTLDEWINNKIIRGTADRNIVDFNNTYPVERFFWYNNITQEKLDYLKAKNIQLRMNIIYSSLIDRENNSRYILNKEFDKNIPQHRLC